MRLLMTDRADHAVDLISICVYFILRQAYGKALRFPQETLLIVWDGRDFSKKLFEAVLSGKVRHVNMAN